MNDCRRMFKVLAVMAMVSAPQPVWAAFKCPAAEAAKGSSEPSLSSDELPGSEPTISTPLKSAIDRMKAKGIKNGDILDHLVMAYCARIDANPTFSDDNKAERVRHFASNLADFIYRGPNNIEEDILVDVPLPPPLYDRLRHAAEKANISDKAWIDQAIRSQLAKP